MNRILTYDNQMEFKKEVKNSFGSKYKFYFDNVQCVDESTSENIDTVVADGSLTFGEAKKRLNKYFIDQSKAEVKKRKAEKKAKEKAKKEAKKMKLAAKKAKAKEKMMAKREAAKLKKLKLKAKKEAKREAAKLKAEKAKERAKAKKAKEKAKKETKKNVSKREIIAEIDYDSVSIKDASKIIKSAMSRIANEIVCFNDKDRAKYSKKLEKLGYNVKEVENELIVEFIDIKSKKIKTNKLKDGNVKRVAPIDNDHPNKNVDESKEVIENTTMPIMNTDEHNPTEEELNNIDNDSMSDTTDMLMNSESPAPEFTDEDMEEEDELNNYSEDDDRYDREMDEDKVDYRRDYFNDFGDDGEVNDDY